MRSTGRLAPTTTSGALAAGAVAPPAASALVTFTAVPGVDEVTVTMIVQPPGGIDDPAASVMSVEATATPAQVPVFAETTLIPTGIGSLKGAVGVRGAAPALPSERVKVALRRSRSPPARWFSRARRCLHPSP